MGMARETLERQLEQAREDLSSWEKALESEGVTGKHKKRDPQWRSLNARRRRLQARLRNVAEIEQREAETEQRKAETA